MNMSSVPRVLDSIQNHLLAPFAIVKSGFDSDSDGDYEFSSIEDDLDDILTYYGSDVQFLAKPNLVQYTVSLSGEPTKELMAMYPLFPGYKINAESKTICPKSSETALVDLAVDCVVSELLAQGQKARPITPPFSERVRKNEKKDGSRRHKSEHDIPPKTTAPDSQLLNDVIYGAKGTESLHQLFAHSLLKKQFIHRFLDQSNSKNSAARFDSVAVTASNGKIVMIDSKPPITDGHYEWKVLILKSDVEAQEFGVVAVSDISSIEVANGGVRATPGFGARSVYGSELSSGSVYYGSFNENGKKRCDRDLSEWYIIGWCAGDVITVRIDVNKMKIRYLLNDKPVRHCMTLQPGKSYYPMISFSGDCQYALL